MVELLAGTQDTKNNPLHPRAHGEIIFSGDMNYNWLLEPPASAHWTAKNVSGFGISNDMCWKLRNNFCQFTGKKKQI